MIGAVIIKNKLCLSDRLDRCHTLFWNAVDLRLKLADFQKFITLHRTHRRLDGDTLAEVSECTGKSQEKLDKFCRQTR